MLLVNDESLYHLKKVNMTRKLKPAKLQLNKRTVQVVGANQLRSLAGGSNGCNGLVTHSELTCATAITCTGEMSMIPTQCRTITCPTTRTTGMDF